MNPLYQSNDSPNGATQPTKAVNREAVRTPNTHNTFDMSYFHYKTQKFGQYEPFFVMEGVPGDTIPFSNSHNVRALPMSSPFLTSLTLNKDYFMIPNQAIQPNTWELIFKNPSQGDDVPEDAQNIFPLFVGANQFVLSTYIDYLKNGSDPAKRLYSLMILELFFSSGSLLYNLGYKMNPIFRLDDVDYSFDSFFDHIMNNSTLVVHVDDVYYSSDELGMYQVLSIIRFFGSRAVVSSFAPEVDFEYFSVRGLPAYNEDLTDFIRMDRLVAYQLACSQFYVNPNVDFIYNAKLYRDNLNNLYNQVIDFPIQTFDYNGSTILYDFCSQVYYHHIMSKVSDDIEAYDLSYLYDYLSALFGYRESLRFGDYFTDSRTRPLAIGDNVVPVVADGVDVIDMSKSIIFQRFRNAVVKLGNNFGDYLRGIFHTNPSPDYHFPKFIVHQDFVISGNEVSNTTSEDQGNIVTNLNTQDDTYVFQVEVDMPCIIMGISSFSVPRVYMQTKERFFMHRDRFDMFNNMLQYIGDQPVYNIERTDLRPNNEVFGYQSRYNEYKQRYSVVSGGFANILPAWTFVADAMFNPALPDDLVNVQSPEFIRAHDYEFNRFMSRVPGVSLGTGFHFIMVYNNKCASNRPMEVNPNTL